MLWCFIVIWIASGAVVPMLWLLGLASRGVSAQSTKQRPAFIEQYAASATASTADPAHGIRLAATTMLAWLLSLTEHRPGSARTAARPRVVGLYLMSGLVGVGVLILLFVAPLNDSGHMQRDLPSIAAQNPATRATMAEARPMQSPASAALAAPLSAPLASPSGELSASPAQGDLGCDAAAVKSGFLDEAPLNSDTEPVAATQPARGDAAEGAGNTAVRPVNDATLPTPVPVAPLTPPVYRAPAMAERGSGHRRARAVVFRPYATGTSRGTWLSVPNQNGGSNS
jgi:hypothetical protein